MVTAKKNKSKHDTYQVYNIYIIYNKNITEVAQGVGGGIKPHPRSPLTLTAPGQTLGNATPYQKQFANGLQRTKTTTKRQLRGEEINCFALVSSVWAKQPSRQGEKIIYISQKQKTAKKENFFFFFLDCSTLFRRVPFFHFGK